MQVQVLSPAPDNDNPNPVPIGDGFGFLVYLECQSKSGGIASDTAAFVIRSFPFLFPLPSALSILQILSAPPGFQRIFGFREVSTGQGLLFHAGGYLYPVAFLPYIAFLCIQLSRYNTAVRREMFSAINHRSLVCRCWRFSSASTSGGIRSTSR